MLAKQYRFHGLGSVRPAMQRGVTARDGLFTVKAMVNAKKPRSRAAVVVSKRVDKRAAHRNRLRRRIYAAMRRQWDNVPASRDIVIIVHDRALGELTPAELDERLERAVSKALAKLPASVR